MQDVENFSDTEVSLSDFGGETYLLYFGLHTMRRVREKQPEFSITSPGMPADEVIPFLIQCAVGEQAKWKDEDHFVEVYDRFTKNKEVSQPIFQKILLAYQNAMGFTDQVYTPVINVLNAYAEQMLAEYERRNAKVTAEVHQKQEEEKVE
jgi:hypothetical protein